MLRFRYGQIGDFLSQTVTLPQKQVSHGLSGGEIVAGPAAIEIDFDVALSFGPLDLPKHPTVVVKGTGKTGGSLKEIVVVPDQVEADQSSQRGTYDGSVFRPLFGSVVGFYGGEKTVSQKIGVVRGAGQGVLLLSVAGVERDQDARLDRVHLVQPFQGAVHFPSPAGERLFGEEEVVAVVHQANRISAEPVFVITRR